MVWPTLGSRRAKEQEQERDYDFYVYVGHWIQIGQWLKQ